MEFTCNSEKFFKAVNSVDTIVKSKLSFSPHLSNILLEISNDKIVVKATNGEMFQVNTVEGDITTPGTISIPHYLLSNLSRGIPDGDLSFKLTEENVLKIIPVTSKRNFDIGILGIPGDDFMPIPSFPEESKSIILDKIYFKKMIQKVIFATSSEPTRYAIHGILLELKNQEISLVATDTRKMALYKTVLPDQQNLEDSILLPKDLLAHLQKLFVTEGPVSISIHDGRIYFKFENYQIGSTLINGEFPKYEMFIPQTNEHSFTADTKSVIEAINLGMGIYEESNMRRIICNIKPGELNLLSQEKEQNQANETIPIQFQGDEFKVGFNVNMFLSVLKQIETEKVEIYFNGEISPFVIKENGRQEATYIIMPVKLSQG